MQVLLWVTVIFISAFYATGKYFIGITHTPPGYVFLGTVHYPTDYFIYLSEFSWGRNSWFFNRILQSTEAPGNNLIRWVNVFLGHTGSLLGLTQFTSYHLSVVFLIACILFLSYKLLTKLLGSKRDAVLGLCIYLTANAFPGWDGQNLSTFDFWYNQGNPFNRFINVPHHLAGQAALLVLILVWVSNKKTIISYICALCSGLILAGVNGVHLAFTAITLLVTKFNIPVLFALIGAAPVLLSIRQTLSTPPLSNMIIWETNNQMVLSPWRLFLGYGPILLALFPATYIYIKKSDRLKIFSLIFTWVSLLLFLSPVPKMLHLGNIRFLIPLTHVLLSAMAVETLKKINTRAVKTCILSFFVGISALSFYATVSKTYTLYQNPANPFYYLPKPVFTLFTYAGDIAKPDDVFLLGWPYNAIFPGVAGARSYFSEVLLVKDPVQTGKLAEMFFSNASPVADRTKFLDDFGITYILHSDQTLSESSGLPIQKIKSEVGFTLWRVVR